MQQMLISKIAATCPLQHAHPFKAANPSSVAIKSSTAGLTAQEHQQY